MTIQDTGTTSSIAEDNSGSAANAPSLVNAQLDTSAGSESDAPEKDPNTVDLDTPIERKGGVTITQVTLRKPKSGGLRGLSLREVLQMDTATLIKLLPRISSPTLSAHEAQEMDPADLVKCGVMVIDFLLSKEARANLEFQN